MSDIFWPDSHRARCGIRSSGGARVSGYERVRGALGAFVAKRNLSEGDRLPSEIELAKTFGVSRAVLRETYRLLERDGFIAVKGGAGTFLRSRAPMVRNSLNELSSTGTLIRRAGLEASAEIVSLESQEPEPEWAEKLGLAAGESVVVAERLRRAGETVIALAWNVFIGKIVGETLKGGILEQSIFLHLEKACGVKVASALTGVFALEPGRPRDRRAKEILGEPALLLKRQHFDLKGAPVFYSLDYIRSDLVELTVRQERNFF
jgi:GntR family transcriptional regulator